MSFITMPSSSALWRSCPRRLDYHGRCSARGGLFAAFQSEEPDPAEPVLAKAMAATGARVLKSCPYRRPNEARERRLVLFQRKED